MAERLPHLSRADARDNHDRILEAARVLFAEHGLEVTMRQVARRAEVGPATLYRHFPTRQALVDAAFAGEMTACRSIVAEGCADKDPWRGFCTIVERISVRNVRNRAFVDAFVDAHPDVDAFARHRRELLRMIADLARRAQAAGGLRHDFAVADFALVVRAGHGLSSAPVADREAAARRFAAIVIDGLHASTTRTTPPYPHGSGPPARVRR